METRRGIAELAAEIVMQLEVSYVVHGYLLPSLTIEMLDEDQGKVWENVGDILGPFIRRNIWLIPIADPEPEASQGSPPGAIEQQQAPDRLNQS